METYKPRSNLDSKSDFPYTRIETTTSSLGLKCKQKHDLFWGVAYSFEIKSLKLNIVVSIVHNFFLTNLLSTETMPQICHSYLYRWKPESEIDIHGINACIEGTEKLIVRPKQCCH